MVAISSQNLNLYSGEAMPRGETLGHAKMEGKGGRVVGYTGGVIGRKGKLAQVLPEAQSGLHLLKHMCRQLPILVFILRLRQGSTQSWGMGVRARDQFSPRRYFLSFFYENVVVFA